MNYILKIKINFIYSKYYATLWGSQVNEEKVDWPPSPWRFLRALVSSWYLNKSLNQKDIRLERDKFIELLNLLTDLPIYILPKVNISSTRHYMKENILKSEKNKIIQELKKDKIINTFIVLPKDNAYIILEWQDVNLNSEQKELLSILLNSIKYFGRSESNAILSIIDNDNVNLDKNHIKALPLPEENFENSNLKGNIVKILSCEKIKTTTNSDKINDKRDLIDILGITTAEMKENGYSIPKGSRWVNYILDENAYEMEVITKNNYNNYKVAYFLVYRKNRIDPKYTVMISEKIHRALIKNSNGEQVFTGCDNLKRPLKGNKHSFIFLLSNKQEGYNFINNMVIYAPMGFNENSVRALHKLNSIYNYNDRKIKFFLIKLGCEKDFQYLQIFSKSKYWKSVTPFVPTLHPKFNHRGIPRMDSDINLQKGSPEYDLVRLIKKDDRFKDLTVKINFSKSISKSELNYMLGFKLNRKEGKYKLENGKHNGDIGYYMEIEFDKEVAGPLAFGYGNHFGLGLFKPIIKDLKS